MTSYIYNMVDTWALSGGPYTSIKMNATDNDAASASLLMDLQVGGTSKFKVAKSGDVTLGSSSILMDAVGGSITAGGTYSSNAAIGFRFLADLFLRRRGAANLALGAADAAAPVAQTLSVQSVVAGTSNTAGTNLTITGSQGTGTGAGGSIVFQVAPAGSSGTAQNALVDALTINSARQLLFAGSASAGLFKQSGSNYIESITGFSMGAGSTTGASMDGTGLTAGPDGQIGFASGNAIGTRDTILRRDGAANTLALRNGTAAQTFNVYNTYTDASNYERGALTWISNTLTLSAENAGTGSNRGISIIGKGVTIIESLLNSIFFKTSSINRWSFDGSGHLFAFADNTYDIGASGANRPRNVYVAGFIQSFGRIELNASNQLVWTSSTKLTNSANGQLTLHNNAETDFGRLNFGGTSASFPALKRNGTALETKLADDTAYAPHAMQYLDVTDGVTAPASATGRARIYVDTADGDLKVIFADGTVKTIVTDT